MRERNKRLEQEARTRVMWVEELLKRNDRHDMGHVDIDRVEHESL